MSIKTGFIAGIVVFLAFILFKNTIQDDTGQMVFAIAFVLAELLIIGLVYRNYR
ncbi:hypothetical protein KIH41_07355 [Litoribacter ruber]|uniref:hypothetical protein n=1 Tax=Litoribacter ruber TaxID=702568 RepID=UPI001BDA2C90|nr:hypothetical protein [Litoribacter ruber]MBT0811092.1 hypothetical protein [Litoribacter ruber]